MYRTLAEQRVNGPQTNEPVDEPSLRARLLSGAKWSVALRLVTQTYRWVITLVMVRLLTPEDYGLNAMLEAPIEILALVGTLGVDAALIRYGVRDTARLAAAFGWLLVVNALLLLALFLGAPFIAAYFNEPELTALVRVVAVVFVLAPFRVLPNALLDMNLDFKLKAQVELKATIVASAVGLALALLGAGVWALVAVSVITAVLTAAILAWYRPWFVRPSLDLALARPLIMFGLTVIGSGFVTLLAGKTVSVLGGPIVGAEVLGLFAVASLLSYLPINKAMPIVQQTLFPAYAKLAQKPEQVRNYMLNVFELCFIAIVPVGIGIAAVATPLVAAVLGERWLHAAVPLALLSLLTPLRLLNLLCHAPLSATGHAGAVATLSVVNLGLMACGVLLAARHGLMGLIIVSAVVATALAAGSQTMAAWRLGLQPIGVLGVIWRPLLACALMGAAAWNVVDRTADLHPLVSLALSVPVGAAVFVGSLWLLMGARLRRIWQVLAHRNTMETTAP
jgi:O-antigen/teichoic acid export membrane protein